MNTTKVPFRNRYLVVYTNNNTSATPIVFLHGNSSSSKIWKQQFESPLGEKYYLLAFDFLGFGSSDHSDQPETDYSITALKDSVVTVINYFNLKDYYLVGHSLGGHVIVQTLDRLEGCKGFISLGAPPITIPPAIEKIYLPTAPVGVMFQRAFTDDQLSVVANNFFYQQTAEPEFFKDDFRNSDGHTRDAIKAILDSTEFKDEVVTLNNSLIPKAFICGAHERSINNEYYHSLNFPNTWDKKLHVIESTGHCPHWENSQAVNEIIDRFIQHNSNS